MEVHIRPRLSHSISFGNDAEKDTAGCRALNRKYIVIGGARKRADGVFYSPLNRKRRSKADFAPTWYAVRDEAFASKILRACGIAAAPQPPKNVPPAHFLNGSCPLRLRIPYENSSRKPGIPNGIPGFLVRRKGFEPLTFWSVARRSIQLS